ncbi:MAG TPA: hypothetical protein VHA80_13435 [Solirubrobacterales bacterium]|nr:hypothetical protein [Solirubrobacterales bacterium]
MVLTIALSLWLVAAPGAGAAASPARAYLLFVPSSTTVAELAAAGFSPGLMSAGLGTVSPEQTYLDIGAGNRVFDSLYDHGLPPLRSARCEEWFTQARERAASAPDEIEPGLLVRTLERAGVPVAGSGPPACPLGIPPTAAALGSSRAGRSESAPSSPALARRLARRAASHDLVIAIATPTGKTDEPVPIGIAGPGYHGDLTSDTTRTNGYVSSTDVAPTILEFLGVGVPDQMIGQAIRGEGTVDPGAIEAREARMAVVSARRGPVIGWSLLAWLLALGLVAVLARGLAPAAVRLAGLAVVYLPVLLLVGAALEPAQYPEMLLVMLGSPLLAGLTLAALRDYRALAVAAGVTVGAYALDAILGSPLSSLSLLGPNPMLGVRFYGIGNELESLLSVLVVGGIGAALAGFAPRLSSGRCAAVFLLVGLVCAGIFASGKFGADVGAAIDFPLGVAVAALVVTGGRRRWILLVILIPLVVLALLALADLLTGANSHFTRSVLDAGGLHSLGDTAQRRLEQTARSFVRPVLLVALPVVAIGVLVAVLRRATLASWVREVPAMRAALIGAVVATIVATLANDSGALLLEIGAAYLLVFLGWAWAEGGRSTRGA